MTELAAASPNLETSGMKRYYAVMEDQSGRKALVVKYQGMGIDGAGDDSCAYFVFAVKDGKLNMVYGRDSWSRRYGRLNKGLIFTGYSTQGAGDNIDWCGRIDGSSYKLEIEGIDKESLEEFEDWIPLQTGDSTDGQTSGRGSICVYGPVKEITDEGILIDNQSGVSSAGDMFLNISLENTKLLDAVTGTPVLQSEIKENEVVYAYIGDVMTMSLPPRVEAGIVLIHSPQDFRVPAYITMKNMEALEGGRFKITAEEGGEFILHAETNVFPYKTRNLVTADDIVEKSKCLIWSDDSGNVDKLLLFSN